MAKEDKDKLTNAEVKSLIDVLNEISNTKVSFSAKIWYALAKNKQTLIRSTKAVEDERIRIVNKYPKKDKNGKILGVAEDKMDEFQNEYLELMSLETEVSLHKIDMKELEKSNGSIQSVPNIYLLFQYLIKQ